MTISSRTPEGLPNRCPLCRKDVVIEPSLLFGDATCPSCGQLLWFLSISGGARLYAHSQSDEVRQRVIKMIADQLDVDESKVTGEMSVLSKELGADSLDMVELVMELEEAFDLLG